MSKKPSFLQPQVAVTETQRRVLKLGNYQRRVREAGECLPRTICNATTSRNYRTGDGETLQPVRSDSLTAYGLPSHGNRT